MAIHWPNGIKAQDEIRGQFHHMIDIAPTVLEAAYLPKPKVINGARQTPIDAVRQ
jgi:arylsulfatase A-like enzyme